MPRSEFVQPAGISNELVAGAQMEMVGIAEHNLRIALVKFSGRQGLDASLGTDRHENGRLDNAMGRMHYSHAGGSAGIGFF